MREHTIQIYSYDELCDDAKRVAHDWYLNCGLLDGYPWSAEGIDTLRSFCDMMRLTLVNYSLGDSANNNHVQWRFACASNDINELTGVRLWRFVMNGNGYFDAKAIAKVLAQDYWFTGYCMDCDILDPIRAFMMRPSIGATWQGIIQECLDSFCYAYAADCDYAQSAEAIAENIRANEFEFTADGRRWIEC